MTTPNRDKGGFFVRAFTAVAILAPTLLVMIAGTVPDSLARGRMMVFGDGGVVAALATALVFRAIYCAGFSRAIRLAAIKPNRSADVTG
jgi:hypothetical protein